MTFNIIYTIAKINYEQMKQNKIYSFEVIYEISNLFYIFIYKVIYNFCKSFVKKKIDSLDKTGNVSCSLCSLERGKKSIFDSRLANLLHRAGDTC